MIGCPPFYIDDAPLSAAGERHSSPEKGTFGADACLRDGEFSAKEARGAEETAAAAAADTSVPLGGETGGVRREEGHVRSEGRANSDTLSNVAFHLWKSFNCLI